MRNWLLTHPLPLLLCSLTIVTVASADSIHCDNTNVASHSATVSARLTDLSAVDFAFPATFEARFDHVSQRDNDNDRDRLDGTAVTTATSGTSTTNANTGANAAEISSSTSTTGAQGTVPTGTSGTVPAPEPTSLILLGSGLLVVAGLVSRRKRITQMIARKSQSAVEA